VLEAHIAAGNGRFRGIRYATGWDPSEEIRRTHTNPPPGLMADRTWREGFAQLGRLGLSFDAWLYHPQLGELGDLANAFPDTAIVLDHVGGPLGYGPYAGRHGDVFAAWKKSMAELAKRPNVTVKLGGLGMPMGWFDFYRRPAPPTSHMLADAFKPWIGTCIELFGAGRCMFESNFPVDKITSGYGVLWNAFKRLTSGASATEKTALFSGTARRIYRLD
jgi:predicted TIM-barrel fold metal-dependent hydrolase